MQNFVRLLQSIFIIGVLTPCGFAQPQSVKEQFEKARQCGSNKNHSCAAETLIRLIENENNIIESQGGHLSLSGAMLEFSMIKAAENWTQEQTKEYASRLIRGLKATAPNSPHGFATAYGLKYQSCSNLKDKACVSDVVAEICPNLDNWSLPLGGHTKVNSFTEKLVKSFKVACE